MTASGGQISAPEWTLTPRPQNQEPNTLAWSCEQARSHARIVPGHTAPLSPSPGLNTLTSLPGPMTLNSTLLVTQRRVQVDRARDVEVGVYVDSTAGVDEQVPVDRDLEQRAHRRARWARPDGHVTVDHRGRRTHDDRPGGDFVGPAVEPAEDGARPDFRCIPEPEDRVQRGTHELLT